MKRIATLLLAGVLLVAFAVPTFAQDTGSSTTATPPADTATTPPATTGTVSSEINLGALFSADELALLSATEKTALEGKIKLLPESERTSYIFHVRKMLANRLNEMNNRKHKGEKQKEKFERKVDRQFAKLLTRADKQLKKHERKEKREEKTAIRSDLIRGVVTVGVGTTANIITLIRDNGKHAEISIVPEKTVLAQVDAEGAKPALFSDFTYGSRMFAFVRKSSTSQLAWTGLVIVKLPPHDDVKDDQND